MTRDDIWSVTTTQRRRNEESRETNRSRPPQYILTIHV